MDDEKAIVVTGGRGSSKSLKIIIISTEPPRLSEKDIEEMIERIKGPKLIQDTVFEYKKEDEIEPNYWRKKPSIFSKTIRCQKPTKKPYIKRLRRVIRM